MLELHSSSHCSEHVPLLQNWPAGHAVAGPQSRQSSVSNWPHVTTPFPEHPASPGWHSSVHGPDAHAPASHSVPVGHGSRGSHSLHGSESFPACPQRCRLLGPAHRASPVTHSSKQSAAHCPSEQYGALGGQRAALLHVPQPLFASTAHDCTPSPAQLVSPWVHQSPQGRCTSSTLTSFVSCRMGFAETSP